MPNNNIINADKSFQNLHIESLVCKRGCTIQDINIVDWITNSASKNFNHTIQGVTTLIDPIISSELSVLGTVNGQQFNPSTILLKSESQTIRGNVFIEPNPFNTNQILPITFENVQLEYFNGIHFSTFIRNLVQRSDRGLVEVLLSSNVRFLQPLTIGRLRIDGQLYRMNASSLPSTMVVDSEIQHYRTKLDEMEAVRVELEDRLASATPTFFDHFSDRQIVKGNVVMIRSVRFRDYNNGRSIIAVLKNKTSSFEISFYKWMPESRQVALIEGRSLLFSIFFSEEGITLNSHKTYFRSFRNKPTQSRSFRLFHHFDKRPGMHCSSDQRPPNEHI